MHSIIIICKDASYFHGVGPLLLAGGDAILLCIEALVLALLVPVLLAAALLLARELGSPACMFGAMTTGIQLVYSLYTKGWVMCNAVKTCTYTLLINDNDNALYMLYYYLLAELHPVALVKLQYLVVKVDAFVEWRLATRFITF